MSSVTALWARMSRGMPSRELALSLLPRGKQRMRIIGSCSRVMERWRRGNSEPPISSALPFSSRTTVLCNLFSKYRNSIITVRLYEYVRTLSLLERVSHFRPFSVCTHRIAQNPRRRLHFPTQRNNPWDLELKDCVAPSPPSFREEAPSRRRAELARRRKPSKYSLSLTEVIWEEHEERVLHILVLTRM